MTERKKIIFQSKLICRCFWNKCQWAWKRESARDGVSHEVPPLSAADSLTFCSLLLCCERRGSARNSSQSGRAVAAGREYYNGVQFWQRECLFPHYAKTLAAFQSRKPPSEDSRESEKRELRMRKCVGCIVRAVLFLPFRLKAKLGSSMFHQQQFTAHPIRRLVCNFVFYLFKHFHEVCYSLELNCVQNYVCFRIPESSV